MPQHLPEQEEHMDVFSLVRMEGFWPGFGSGVLALVGLGFVVYRLNIWIGNILRAGKPQRVVHFTDRTPGQVFGTSLGNTLKLSGLLVVILAVVFGLSGLAPSADCRAVGIAGGGLFLAGMVLSGLS
jgi:hypothetical protein